MTKLDTAVRLIDHDGIHEALVDMHAGLDTDGSLRVDARLILLLANHIGDDAVVLEAIECARGCPGR